MRIVRLLLSVFVILNTVASLWLVSNISTARAESQDIIFSSSSISEVSSPTAATPIVQKFGQLPLSFIPNQGQLDDISVRYYLQGKSPTVYFSHNGVTMDFRLPGKHSVDKLPHQSPPSSLYRLQHFQQSLISTRVNLQFVAANPSPLLRADDRLPGVVNYYAGNNSDRSRSQIPTYGQITYSDLWPGIDLMYNGQQTRLKSTFTVAPGADPDQIQLAYPEAGRLIIDEQGNLLIQQGEVEIREKAPIAWQEIPDVGRVLIPVAFQLVDAQTYSFVLPEGYNPAYALVIDPELVYSTFIGGEYSEQGEAITVDASGNAYIVFNVFGNSYSSTNVFKLNSEGTALLYQTFITGGASSYGFDIAVDETGYAYITGDTTDPYLSTPGALDEVLGGINDAFVVKLNVSGAVEFATYLGGGKREYGGGIALDEAGNIYVTGYTQSGDFPVTAGSYDNDCGADGDGDCDVDSWGNFKEDAFVVKLNSTGTDLVYATFLGGEEIDYAFSVTVDDGDNTYVTGKTFSNDFPTTLGAYDRLCGLNNDCSGSPGLIGDAFIVKLNSLGTGLEYATFWGYGNVSEEGYAIAVDSLGNAHVAGFRSYRDIVCAPVTSCNEAFAIKLNQFGTDLIYEVVLGLHKSYAVGIAMDDQDNAYVTGITNSSTFPATSDAIQQVNGGGVCNESPCADAFVAKLKPNGTIDYATLFGGDNFDGALDLAVKENHVFFTGRTSSENFTTTPGVFQEDMNPTMCGWEPNFYFCGDAFVAKLTIEPLGIRKSAPVTATVGSEIPYTLTVSNRTGITLTNVVVTDTIPGNAHFISGGTRVGNVVSWTIPSLANGTITQTGFVVSATQTITNSNYRVSAAEGYSATGTISVTTVIEDNFIAGLVAENDSPTLLGQATTLTATITAGDNVTYTWAFGDGDTAVDAGAVVTHTYPSPGPYTAVVTASNSRGQVEATTFITITGEPHLLISKTAPVTVTAGSRITYTLTITNAGTASATDLVITDTIPSGATYVSGGSKVGNVISWTVPSLAGNGGVTQTTFVVTATRTISNSDYRVAASGGYDAIGSVTVVTIIEPGVLGQVFLPVILK